MKMVLNAAAVRMIYGGRRQDSITLLLLKLHWTSLVERVHFKICLTVYTSPNGLSPEYDNQRIRKTVV